jgi:hypothetical protein
LELRQEPGPNTAERIALGRLAAQKVSALLCPRPS